MNKITSLFLGLGKTKFNSSICLITDDIISNSEIILTERITRQKASGAWPFEPLKEISEQNIKDYLIAENRDVLLPIEIENYYDQQFPFYDFLKKNHLEKFTSKFNPDLQFITHHESHAYAALAMSPFEKSIILVLDGAGTKSEDFLEPNLEAPRNSYEECSVYLQDQGVLTLVHKRWTSFKSGLAPTIGAMYEKFAEYIFNSPNASGKVMGLAPFGNVEKISDRWNFQNQLDWKKAYRGKDKASWETDNNYTFFCDLAATVQNDFEIEYNKLLIEIKKLFPEYTNLILAGGCAMNCTNNAKILKSSLFDNMYVLPFPGDESIGFGLANCLRLKNNPERWHPFSFSDQSAYLGSKSSIPTDDKVVAKLNEKNITFEYSDNIISLAVNDLIAGKIIGWFQGRSESGPRALGNRSILARPDRVDLKNYLNEHIKFRENFRPYGCSTIFEQAHEYFEVDPGFYNPYMSYAIKVRTQYKDLLKEVSHIDGTSRMQIVHKGQNQLFHELIKTFGEKTNIYCLLNTSLNVMGEPIVETIDDAIRFFKNTPVDSLYIGNFKITRKLNMVKK